jgi:hypothetical protein
MAPPAAGLKARVTRGPDFVKDYAMSEREKSQVPQQLSPPKT